MRFTPPLVLKPLAALLATTGLLAMALPVHATVVVDGLSAEAFASAAGGTPVMNGPNTSLPTASAYANAYGSDVDGNYSDGYGSSFGRTSGAYGVGSSGSGVFDATGLFTRSWSITNDSTTAQLYSFSFYVYGGSMGTYSNGATGSGSSSYLLDIVYAGYNIFSSGATINSDGTYTQSGTALTNAQASGTSYYWSGTTLTLDLGVLDPGQKAVLSYDMVSHSVGNYGFSEQCSEYGYVWNGDGYGYGDSGYGDYPVDGYGGYGEYCYSVTGGSSAFTGDPSGIDGTPLTSPTISARAANDVPEPATLALLGLGLTAAAALRPRRRRD